MNAIDPGVDPVREAEARIARRRVRAAGLNPPLPALRRAVYGLRLVLRITGIRAVTPMLALAYLTGSRLVVAVAAAVTNAAVVLSWTWEVDHYEEEPWRLVARTLLWGALPAVVLAFIGELWFRDHFVYLLNGAAGPTFQVVVVAPVVEEICKGMVLVYLCQRYRDEYDGMVDGLLYGALVGIGFSMSENILYYLAAPAERLEHIIFLRGLLFGMNHAVFSACFGLGLAIARDSNRLPTRRVAPVLGLLAAIFLHMSHNLLVSDSMRLAIPLAIGAAVGWFVLVRIGRRHEEQWIRDGLSPEVEAGLLTAKEVGEIASIRQRVANLGRILASEPTPGPAHHRRRFCAVATELAFARHKAQLEPESDRYKTRIAKLRGQMIELRLHPPELP